MIPFNYDISLYRIITTEVLLLEASMMSAVQHLFNFFSLNMK